MVGGLILQAPPTVARVASLAEAEATAERAADAASPAEEDAVPLRRLLHIPMTAMVDMDHGVALGLVITEATVDMDHIVALGLVITEAMVDMDHGVALGLVITLIALVSGYTTRHPAALPAHTIARDRRAASLVAPGDPRVVRRVDAASLEEDAALPPRLLPVLMTITTPGADGADTTVTGPHLAPGMAARVARLVLVEDPRAASLVAPRGLRPVGMDRPTMHPGVDMEDGADTTVTGPHLAPGMAARVARLVLVEDPRAASLVAPRTLRPVGMVDMEAIVDMEDGTHQVQTTTGLVDRLVLPIGMEAPAHLQAPRVASLVEAEATVPSLAEVEATAQRAVDAASLEEDAVPLRRLLHIPMTALRRLLHIPMTALRRLLPIPMTAKDGSGMDTVKTMGIKHALAHQAPSSLAFLP